MTVSFDNIRQNTEIAAYIRKADESLIALGYTEHSFAHVGRVADTARRILLWLGQDERTAELAAIAGWLHDIGNVVNRVDHAQSGAVMAFRILDKLGFDPDETATIVTAIGNQDMASFDIHDRVNFSVTESQVRFEPGVIRLSLTIDTKVCPLMDYFEIFLDRMILCRKAAEKLGVRFALTINGQAML